jgi:hypothetical protein
MLEGKSAKEWIDLYVDTKPAELRDVAEKLRKLMKQTVKSAKESVNSWKIPTYESTDVPFHGWEISCDVWFFAWNVAARSCRATGRDREECAAREVAHRGRSEGNRTEKIDRGRGAVEQEGTDGEGDEVQEVDRA